MEWNVFLEPVEWISYNTIHNAPPSLSELADALVRGFERQRAIHFSVSVTHTIGKRKLSYTNDIVNWPTAVLIRILSQRATARFWTAKNKLLRYLVILYCLENRFITFITKISESISTVGVLLYQNDVGDNESKKYSESIWDLLSDNYAYSDSP